MRLFYDLETTGLKTTNQILTACFITTDNSYNIVEICNYRIALNPLEIPAESAIAVNAVDITQHMINHTNRFSDLMTEEEFALAINEKLSNFLSEENSLIGYNSNKFDITFLRKVLIKWGYNPYYNFNKFPMVDLYHHISYVKLHKPYEFEGMKNSKLGTVYRQLFKEDPVVLHEAEADVLYCVKIAKFLLEKFGWDITLENNKVNNLFNGSFNKGDLIYLIDSRKRKGDILYTIHDINKSKVLIEHTKTKKFSTVNKTDFALAKKIKTVELEEFKTLDSHFSTYESTREKGVEEFVYHIQFKDFEVLANCRLDRIDDVCSNQEDHLTDLVNSQIITRVRPIKHTDEGIEVYNMSDSQKKFIIRYFEKYGLGENDSFDGEANQDKVKLLRDYKVAYRELVESLKSETGNV